MGGTRRLGCSPLTPSILRAPVALQATSRSGSASQPLRAGAFRAPQNLMVGLSAWGPSLESLMMFPWEAEKVVLACVTSILRLRGVYSKWPTQPLGLHVWGPYSFFLSPVITLLSFCCLFVCSFWLSSLKGLNHVVGETAESGICQFRS